MAITKVIISSKSNLDAKYGDKMATVKTLLDGLVKYDAGRGITTHVLYIDDAASMTTIGETAIKTITLPAAKKAVDAIYRKLNPAYIVLFGAQDVFPFQEITNPTSDDDQDIPSDLPYACDAAYSKLASAFTGPTRIVGRIPDIPGLADVKYLRTVIDTITKYKQVKSEKLLTYFALTADVWTPSTQLSLRNMFGNHTALKRCPPSKSPYTKEALKPLTHFYNCHGSSSDPNFYGQKGQQYPVCQNSTALQAKISKGTIVAAECCYGAELFDPTEQMNNELSIANTYFKNKAIAFVGSSNIAYGPASGNDQADLITQYFIKNVINGASTGRALLEARLKYASVKGPALDPFDYKTLAQFYLLGDPSVHAAEVEVNKSRGDTVENRRITLQSKGINLAKTVSSITKLGNSPSLEKNAVYPELIKLIKKEGFDPKSTQTLYEVDFKNTAPKRGGGIGQKAMPQEKIYFRTLTHKSKENDKFTNSKVIVIKESKDKILDWNVYFRK
jgi:hypothetical protein